MNKNLFRILLFVAFPFLLLPLLPILILFPLVMPPLFVLSPGLLLIMVMVLTGFTADKPDNKSS